MDVMVALLLQGVQMFAVLVLAPLLLGFTRKVKARLLRRRGPPVLQPYRDLLKLIRKEVVLAENASWLFRSSPYMIFSATWVAAALVPTFATELTFSWVADLIAIIALIGSARFFLALAGMDIGTSFGGIGSSREMMFASLAEPAMIMIVFTVALVAGSTQLSFIASYMQDNASLRVSLGMGLIALVIVAVAENARIPVDNPATHLELTMVHEAMVLEYSGRHLAMIELAAAIKLLLYVSLIACIFVPWGLAPTGSGPAAYTIGAAAYLGKLLAGGFLLVLFETSIAKMRVFRVPQFLGTALMLGLLGALLLFVSRSFSMSAHHFDVAHMLAGGLVLVSFMLLYQDRMFALLNMFALHAVVLAASVAWQAYIQKAEHLYVPAAIALGLKAFIIPLALRRVVIKLGIHRAIENVAGVGLTMLAGMGLVGLSMVVMLKATSASVDPLAREDLAFALSVVLLGLLMMVMRRNAVSQIVGFMSMENGLILAATGAKGMPLVIEISIAFSILVAFIVIGVFLFRIRERFDSVDVQALDEFRGERR